LFVVPETVLLFTFHQFLKNFLRSYRQMLESLSMHAKVAAAHPSHWNLNQFGNSAFWLGLV
jgi:hypothetical protein